MVCRPIAFAFLMVFLIQPVWGQTSRPDPYSARMMLGPESYTWQANRGAAAQQSQRSSPARYGNAQAGARRSTVKPFNTVVSEPTVSPYLNLYRQDGNQAAPNYYAFVRPQQQQLEQNRQQSAQLQVLERRLQQASYASPAGGGRVVNAVGSTGAARYGDTSHYYSGWRR